MPKQRPLELDNKTPTPFTLILVIYRARLALRLTGWEQLDLSKQCEYLLSDNINTKSKRKKVITDLIQSEHNFDELEQKSYLRIHIKYILKMYYKESQLLSSSTDINEWTHHDIMISLLFHLIDNVKDEANKKTTSHPKVWEFANYLRKYFYETGYDGHTFLDTFGASKSGQNNDKPTKGFGLQLMKTVCAKYTLKSGPYSKVKKQCNIWASGIHQKLHSGVVVSNVKVHKPMKQIMEEEKQNENKPKYSGNWSKFVTQIPADYHKPKASNDAFVGKSWFWFNDSGGFKWIPYRQIDIEKLNKAWSQNEKSCVILNGDYRVEFNPDRSTPAGNQYNNRQSNAGGRTVICADTNASNIHGITVAKQPL